MGLARAQEGDQTKIKVKVRLNLHGLVTVENAHQIVEEDVEEAAPKAGDTPMQVRSATAAARNRPPSPNAIAVAVVGDNPMQVRSTMPAHRDHHPSLPLPLPFPLTTADV